MEILKCPSCGSPDVQKLNFTEYQCHNCDTKLRMSDDKSYLIVLQGYPCHKCGFANDSGTLFCGKCGEKLIKYCINCSEIIRIDLDHCTKCGGSDFSISEFCDVYILPPKEKINKIEAIKAVRSLNFSGLVEAKELVENGGLLKKSVRYEEMNAFNHQFKDYGLSLEFHPSKGNSATPSSEISKATAGGGCASIIIVGFVFLLGSLILTII